MEDYSAEVEISNEIKDKLINMLTLNENVATKRHGWKKDSLELRKLILEFSKNSAFYRKKLVEESK